MYVGDELLVEIESLKEQAFNVIVDNVSRKIFKMPIMLLNMDSVYLYDKNSKIQ